MVKEIINDDYSDGKVSNKRGLIISCLVGMAIIVCVIIGYNAIGGYKTTPELNLIPSPMVIPTQSTPNVEVIVIPKNTPTTTVGGTPIPIPTSTLKVSREIIKNSINLEGYEEIIVKEVKELPYENNVKYIGKNDDDNTKLYLISDNRGNEAILKLERNTSRQIDNNNIIAV
jgi:hypothetical protein